MGEILIRPYEERDWEAIETIHDAARVQELALAGLSEAFLPLKIAAEREDLFGYTLDVAEMDGRVVGFMACTEDELAWLYVEPASMRRGVGRALTMHALRRAEGEMELEALVGNVPARRLYEKCGFTLKDTVSGRMPGNESFRVKVWCMHHE